MEYPLLFDDSVYADMSQYSYDSSRWMSLQLVLVEAARIRRSAKKLDELCKKGAVLIGDRLTMRKTDNNGVAFAFTAVVCKWSSLVLSITNHSYCLFHRLKRLIRPLFPL